MMASKTGAAVSARKRPRSGDTDEVQEEGERVADGGRCQRDRHQREGLVARAGPA
jgi:hypothetical protein